MLHVYVCAVRAGVVRQGWCVTRRVGWCVVAARGLVRRLSLGDDINVVTHRFSRLLHPMELCDGRGIAERGLVLGCWL